MKAVKIQSALKVTCFITIAMVLFAASLQAQNSGRYKSAYQEKFTKNLIAGILHNNQGIKNCAIYFAGYYKVKGTTDALIQQLKKEENDKTRGLIVYSLFMIGEKDGLSAVYRLSAEERDKYLKNGFNKVINEYDSTESVAAYSSPGK